MCFVWSNRFLSNARPWCKRYTYLSDTINWRCEMFNARRRNVVCSLIFGCWRRKIFRAHVKINEWTWKLWIINRTQATEMTRRIRCSDAWLIAWQRSCFAKLFVSEISETTKTTLCQILVEVTQRHTVPLQWWLAFVWIRCDGRHPPLCHS